MERLVQNVKYVASAVVNGVSAVCSGVVATGVTSGLNLEGLRSLGFYLNLLPSSLISPCFYTTKLTRRLSRTANTWRF
ncbi:hypothetical protein Vspart_01578 [Vibrio spartinae]|uniref:Uncharacterized protein n=1 Tax=Vibrio spartinae TaxID=1918945 RepID=A0ABX6QYN1_9VIBR|nr:hypothetical protein Vspart_01578 [Vibrio spartinae]